MNFFKKYGLHILAGALAIAAGFYLFEGTEWLRSKVSSSPEIGGEIGRAHV